jgi:hypothetical protein
MTDDERGARRSAKTGPGDDLRFSPRPNRAHEIPWRPWGEAAFAEARREGKPVLLSISAVWCHWCHVLDETSYSDARVIAAIAAGFVAVRVDSDRRPDLDRRYNMGGWPTIAFLTPAGDVLAGATYLPPERLLDALARVRAFFAGRADELASAGAGAGSGATAPLPGAAAPAEDELRSGADGVCRTVAGLYDPSAGGLGTAPKFPQPDALRLLLVGGARAGDDDLVARALHSLDAVARGLQDPVEQGFYRYATLRDWTAPHYEKLLDDNARLALAYLDAFALSGRPAYAEVAGDTLAFFDVVLRDPERPVFFGSEDADERYTVHDAGGRAALPRPAIDRTVYVDANALAARALVRAAILLDRPALLGEALAALDLLWDTGRGRQAMVHYLGGPVAGLLGDQAHMTAALLDAHEATGDRAYLARARLLADWALEHLRDADGGFVDRPPSPSVGPATGAPLRVLDGAAEAADALIRLAAFSGVPAYREAALAALAACAPLAAGAGPLGAPWALAALRLADHPVHIVVVGRRGDTQAGALLRAGLRVADPLRSVQLLDPDADAETIARAGYTVAPDGAAAFVCLAGVCLEPTSDPAAVAGLATRPASA